MNKEYRKIISTLRYVEKNQTNYHKILENSDKNLNDILNQIPDEDPIKKDLINYIHSLEGLTAFPVVTKEIIQESNLRTNLLKKLESKNAN